MGGFVKRRQPLADLRFDAGLHLGAGLVLVAAGAWAGGRLLDAPVYLIQSVLVFLAIALLVFQALPQHLPRRRFGPANKVTLLRAAIAALLAGLIGHGADLMDAGWLLAAAAGFSLALDGVDGWAARRSKVASRFGARFDMELDAFLILVLAVLVYEMDKAGAWVLLSGVLRYLFAGALLALPALRLPLPASRRRQTVCVVQSLALVLCLTPLAVPPASTALASGALALLALSFAADLAWLLRSIGKQGEHA